MSWVGNDVVDLGDPATATSHLRERFVHRVCAESERAALARAESPRVHLWCLFAAKEAAYKLVCKRSPGPPPPFAHRRFVVAEDLGSVRYDGHRLQLRVEVVLPRIHAVAWLGDDAPLSGVEVLGEGHDASLGVRALLWRALGGEGWAIHRPARPGSWDGRGPPRLLRHGRPAGLDVSLSHDGRYVAFSVVPGLGPAADA